MNPKQAAPLIVTLPALAAAAPALIVGGTLGLGAIFVLKWLLSDDKQKEPEATITQASTETRKPAETVVFHEIPAEIAAVKPASAPRAVVMQPVPKVSVPVPAPAAVPVIKSAVPVPKPTQKKLVTRKDLANVFQDGTRTLTRTAAVAALKRFGFGKTAAYAALSPDGRFSAWLQCAPDGIITWTD